MSAEEHKDNNNKRYAFSIAGWTILIIILIILLENTTNIIFPATLVTVAVLLSVINVFVQLIRWFKKRHYKATSRERFLKLLASFMCLFFLIGTALYLRVLYLYGQETGDKLVNAEYLLRAVMESLGLFMFKVNGILLSRIGDHMPLRGAVSIMALLSFMCTLAVVVNLAYSRLKSYIKITHGTKITSVRNHLYVFIGTNEASRLLASSINKEDPEHSIIIAIDNIHEKDEESTGWNSIVKFFTIRKQTYAEIEELNARIAFVDTPLYDLRIEGEELVDIFELINLASVRRLIGCLQNYKNSELHIFFLSDDENQNIRSLSVVARDITINSVNRKIKQRMYYHARRNGLNRVIEDIALKQELDVCIVDSAHLTVEQLKVNGDFHPINLMDIDENNPATVSSKFTSLIIGFGEVGQDALKFLYEYGAFVDSHSTPENVCRSPFTCIAVDKEMNKLKGRFGEFLDYIKRDTTNETDIRLLSYDTYDYQFFKKVIEPNSKELNYIVIALGDEDKSMACAIGIFKYIRKIRSDLSRLRIFVRSYNYERENYMQRIADHYNEGYNRDCPEQYRTEAVIIPFGKQENIYSYNMIINDKLINCGKRYQKRYAEMRDDPVYWEERRQKLLGFKDENGMVISREKRKVSINSIRKLRRQEYQDVSNAFHSYTKIYILRKTFEKDGMFDWDYFFQRYFDTDGLHPDSKGLGSGITYPGLTDLENTIIRNIACLEHIRWMASHEMLGYTKNISGHSCNEETMQHNCLVPWQELDEESEKASDPSFSPDYKSYDYGVVDVTLHLFKENVL